MYRRYRYLAASYCQKSSALGNSLPLQGAPVPHMGTLRYASRLPSTLRHTGHLHSTALKATKFVGALKWGQVGGSGCSSVIAVACHSKMDASTAGQPQRLRKQCHRPDAASHLTTLSLVMLQQKGTQQQGTQPARQQARQLNQVQKPASCSITQTSSPTVARLVFAE